MEKYSVELTATQIRYLELLTGYSSKTEFVANALTFGSSGIDEIINDWDTIAMGCYHTMKDTYELINKKSSWLKEVSEGKTELGYQQWYADQWYADKYGKY